jgi:hypothetical protein
MPSTDWWTQHPPPQPSKVLWNGQECDPFDLVDNGTKKADEIDWLNEDLRELASTHSPKEADIDENGNVDISAMETSGTQLFQTQKSFINFYQFKQFADLWACAWGTQLGTHSGTQLHCFFKKQSERKPDTAATVSPSKKRNRVSMKTGCNFKIMSSDNVSQRKDGVARYRKAVRITSMNLQHTCRPCLTSFRIAKKASGAYSSKQLELKPVMNLFYPGLLQRTKEGNFLRPFSRVVCICLPTTFGIFE